MHRVLVSASTRQSSRPAPAKSLVSTFLGLPEDFALILELLRGNFNDENRNCCADLVGGINIQRRAAES